MTTRTAVAPPAGPVRTPGLGACASARMPLAGLLAVALLALSALSVPAVARADWSRASARRSSVEPFFACARHRGGAHCDAIHDPVSGSRHAGPLRAGAITMGPVQQVSPALYGSGMEGGYSPEDLRKAYNLPSSSAGAGQTVAIVDAHDDPNAEADLAKYRSHYGIGECTTAGGCFRKVNQAGGSVMPSANAEWAEEISLDLDMVSAVCPNCHILLIEASTEEGADLAAAEREAVHLGATEVSNSFGESVPSEPEFASSYDHPGIPTTASAGDTGFVVESPASNPAVIAVGGTALTPEPKSSRGWKETAWAETGSGCSKEPKPTWQTDSGCAYRTNNDVAAVASTNTPVSIYDSYKTSSPWLLLGGTSVSSPILAGAMALASPYTRSLEGAQALYLQAKLSGAGVLDDVLSGKNGACGNYLCEARVGYDAPTGLGTLAGAPNVPAPVFTTGGASAVGATEATLEGTVNPEDVTVSECRFEYGTSASYGSSAPCAGVLGSGSSPVATSASLRGLYPSTTYHYRLAGSSHGYAGAGQDATFTTAAVPPAVRAEGYALPRAMTSATLQAQVDPNGATVSECRFEYATASEYAGSHEYPKQAPCVPSPGAGQEFVKVSATISGLAPGTLYHFRVTATGQAAQYTTSGADATFTTLLPLPVLSTGVASEVTAISARLNALLTPELAPVSECVFEYGATEAYGLNAPCSPAPGPELAPFHVSAAIAALTPHATYHFRITATNAEGAEAHGADESFTTAFPAPAALTGPASAITETTATLAGSVEDFGASVSVCRFEYGTSEASFSEGSAACSPEPGPREGSAGVSAGLLGLKPGTTYLFRLLAGTVGGTGLGTTRTFTTPAAPPRRGTPAPSGGGAPGGTSSTPPKTGAAAGEGELAGTTLAAGPGGTVSVRIRCRSARASCRGMLTLQALSSAAAGTLPRFLASGSFAVAAGKTLVVRLHLSSSARRLLARAHVLRAVMTIASQSAGSASRSQRVRVTITARKHSHH